jgi:putative protease
MMGENLEEVGRVSHFFGHINVAVVEVSGKILVGDRIAIKGPTTDIEQIVNSMEIEHSKIKQAIAGQSIGMKVEGHARENDTVYKIT